MSLAALQIRVRSCKQIPFKSNDTNIGLEVLIQSVHYPYKQNF